MFGEILAQLIAQYREKAGDLDAIEKLLLADGVIAHRGQLPNDHIAFRTFGAPRLGIASLDPLLTHHGYVRRDAYRFAAKHLDAYWYAPNSDELPRIFISELRIGELCALAARTLRSYTDAVVRAPLDGVDYDDAGAVARALASLPWALPSLADYQALLAQSEYAAWTIANGYRINHLTLGVHALRFDLQSVAALSRYLEDRGFCMNGAGGTVKVSPDGLLVQSSTVARPMEMAFSDNETALVAGPYIEFAERRVLPQFAELPASAVRREHRRDGFEATNADRIFESTDLTRRSLMGSLPDGTQDGIFSARYIETARHRTAWIEAGPAHGPLMIFVHGWPELGIVWRAQLDRFARYGWRCIAPDMRGYGGSSVPTATSAYAMREVVTDMIELHDALGGAPAVWVGHDWGSPVVWSIAAHHPARCRGVASISVPYFARGFALANLVPLVDRTLYPAETYPVGQWDYFLFYREHFSEAARDFEADVTATLALLYRSGSSKALGKRAITADVRAKGGWFGPARRAPPRPRDTAMLEDADFDTLVAAFTATGFSGANAWYMNDAANLAYAAEARNFGRLTLPVLFLHGTWDTVCETVHSRLAEPMRADCADLSEVTIDGGHELMIERPAEVNAAIREWLAAHGLQSQMNAELGDVANSAVDGTVQ